MISKKLSLNKVCIILATTILLLSVVMFSVLYILTKEMSVVFCSMAFCLLFLLCVTAFVILIRRKLTLFSEILCCTLDEMMNGKIDISQVAEEENLFYKINHRLVRLYEVMQESKNSVASERADLQELISDISHQVKTPISNLKMINATLLEQEVPQDKQREFLLASGTQLDKLDFLMQAMIKTSRLETGVISLEKKQQPIYDTLAMALGSIFMNAERKHIQVEVNCPETLVVSHDRKWTAEALFNILDNAVKYTPEYGSIRVCVESWEMHLKVSITDTGKGIPENQQGAIFRRFYREEDVHDIEGIGIYMLSIRPRPLNYEPCIHFVPFGDVCTYIESILVFRKLRQTSAYKFRSPCTVTPVHGISNRFYCFPYIGFAAGFYTVFAIHNTVVPMPFL